MLISLDYKFIFVANLKTASTSIETALRPYADIALVESRFEKHAPLSEIERRFFWVFDLVPRDQLLIFGVVRDPVDYVLSIYNSHADPKFADSPNLSTRGLGFNEFRARWAEENVDQLLPQYARFVGRDGSLGLNYAISYGSLPEEFRVVTDRLGIRAELDRVNVSEPYLRRQELTTADLDWIECRFPEDRHLLSHYTHRFLTAEERAAATTNFPVQKVHRLDPSNAYQLSGGWEELLHALYRVLLLREPDASGLRSGLESLRNGVSFEALMRAYLRSAEFSRVHQKFVETYVRSRT